MKRLIIFVTYSFCLFACSSKKIPNDILSIDSMAPVMWDMLMAGEYTNYLRERDTSKNIDTTRYYTEVLELHHVSKQKFYKSYNFYKEHPDLNKTLLDSVSSYSNRNKDEDYQNLYGKRNYIQQNDSAKKHMLKRDSLFLKNKVKTVPAQ